MNRQRWLVLFFILLAGLSAWAGVKLWIVLGDDKAPPIQNSPLADERIIDPETIAAYHRIGGVHGGFWYGDSSSYYWIYEGNTPVRLPGFKFEKFPKQKLPRVNVPFGLNLDDSDVTDADLDALSSIPNLRVVNLRRTHVTYAGVEEFRKWHPTWQITHSTK